MCHPLLAILADIWRILLRRRDIDSLAKELVGNFSLAALPPSDNAPHVHVHALLDVACWFKTIFDLQRTHLQAWTPHGDPSDSNTNRRQLSYLMSYDVVSRIIEFLSRKLLGLIQQRTDHDSGSAGGDNDDTRTRNLLIRTILSGVRVYCLHPDRVAGSDAQLVGLFDLLLCKGELPQHLQRDELFMLKVCRESLRNTPAREKHLYLMCCDMKLYPLDKQRLIGTARARMEDSQVPWSQKYWVLYDISWSIIGAAIQCKVDGANLGEQNIHEVASGISNLLLEVSGSLQAASDDLASDSLANIFPLLELLLGCQTGIPQPATDDESINRQGCPELLSLERFLNVLGDRKQALCDSNEELWQVVLDVLALCSDPEIEPADENKSVSPSPGFCIVNCPLVHIITQAQSRKLIKNNGLSREPGAQGIARLKSRVMCPECATPTPITHLREITQVREIRSVIMAAKDRLDKMREFREKHRVNSPGLQTMHVGDNSGPTQTATHTENQNLPPMSREPDLQMDSGSSSKSGQGNSAGAELRRRPIFSWSRLRRFRSKKKSPTNISPTIEPQQSPLANQRGFFRSFIFPRSRS